MKEPKDWKKDVNMQNALTWGSTYSDMQLYNLAEDNLLNKKLATRIFKMKEELKKYYGVNDISPEDFTELYLHYSAELVKSCFDTTKRINDSIVSVTDLSSDNDIKGVLEANINAVINVGKLIKGD